MTKIYMKKYRQLNLMYVFNLCASLNKKSANGERSLYLIITTVTNSHYIERHYYCMSKYEISEWVQAKILFHNK
ncbi:hypothetical protein F8156_21230 [Bacillus cereus]|nr:hypothetical protein F8156_21230 [Bacillus cereus]